MDKKLVKIDKFIKNNPGMIQKPVKCFITFLSQKSQYEVMEKQDKN